MEARGSPTNWLIPRPTGGVMRYSIAAIESRRSVKRRSRTRDVKFVELMLVVLDRPEDGCMHERIYVGFTRYEQ